MGRIERSLSEEISMLEQLVRDAEIRLKSAPKGELCVSSKGRGYECQLILDGNVTLYPDFTILKMPQRKEIYLEHLGMLDDDEYLENTIWKLNVFEKNAIYLGDSLFLTRETGKCPLNSKALEGMLHSWFYIGAVWSIFVGAASGKK